MKITRSQLEKAIRETVANESLSGDLGVRVVANAFVKYLGIEIVPDPEPEIVRPLRIEVGAMGPTWTAVIDSSGHFGRSVLCVNNGNIESAEETRKNLIPLVSAYNAAGERKRLTVERPEDAKPIYAKARVYEINGEEIESLGPDDAVGSYVRRHASDLGLEIVES